MAVFNTLLSVLWIFFIAYWLISAAKSKKTIRNSTWWQGASFRFLALVVIILLFKSQAFQNLALNYDTAPHELAGIIGIILCVLGLALAVWARVYLGRNWGMPMSVKENPELVTSGPYKLIRHPIYTGILVAAVGSALVDGLWWLIFVIIYIAYFVYSAQAEEKIMTKEFPNEYPAYKKRTKMLLPFIF